MGSIPSCTSGKKDRSAKRRLSLYLLFADLRTTAYSFGSLMFPRNPKEIAAVLDGILSVSPVVPVVFARDPKMIPLSPELEGKLRARGDDFLLCQWCPQQTVLQHPVSERPFVSPYDSSRSIRNRVGFTPQATGLFLTHGGTNSANEAIVSGVPMLFWPQS